LFNLKLVHNNEINPIKVRLNIRNIYVHIRRTIFTVIKNNTGKRQ